MVKITVSKASRGMGFNETRKAINKLRRAEVLVGVPADKTLRKGEAINNASLLYIHSQGSPLQHLPARPIVEPAIEQSQDLINPQLANASRAILNNDPRAAERFLERAGTIAANAAKRRFGSADLAPNAPSTIARKGSDRPLIDEGLLRRSVTYVVRIDGERK